MPYQQTIVILTTPSRHDGVFFGIPWGRPEPAATYAGSGPQRRSSRARSANRRTNHGSPQYPERRRRHGCPPCPAPRNNPFHGRGHGHRSRVFLPNSNPGRTFPRPESRRRRISRQPSRPSPASQVPRSEGRRCRENLAPVYGRLVPSQGFSRASGQPPRRGESGHRRREPRENRLDLVGSSSSGPRRATGRSSNTLANQLGTL